MKISLADHALTELRQLADEVRRELGHRDKQGITEARDQVYAIAKSLGLNVRHLLGKHSKDLAQQEQLASKYRDPKNSRQVWTGRGRRPHWVRAWLADSNSLADLVVGTGG